MSSKSRFNASFDKVAGFFGLTDPDQDPSKAANSMAFDGLRLDHAHRAPNSLPPLFGSCVRRLGRPEQLFPNKGKASTVPIPEDIIKRCRMEVSP